MSQDTAQSLPMSAQGPEPGTSYRFAIEYTKRDGRRLGQIPVAPDFQPAREYAYFRAVRRGVVPPITAPAHGEAMPLWHDAGPPYCRGIRVAVSPTDGSPKVGYDLPKAFLRELAEEKVAAYVERGELEAGERYRYHVCAYPAEAPSVPSTAEPDMLEGLEVEAEADPIPLAESALDAFLESSEAVGEPHEADAPVFVAPAVLEEARALAHEAGELETGGILVGRLHRDRSRPEVFAEVVAQIPARHAAASAASFSFTPETWAAADAAIELRGRGELFLGWWHSHPRFCGSCPEERWRSCILARPFFSPDDVHLHRTCFSRAYHLALLISDLPEGGPTPALFGWRLGKVASRSYRVLHPAPLKLLDPHEEETP